MRAKEFIIEGPVDKAGDWMNKQVIDRRAQDKANVQKQNVPKIAKLIQQQLEGALHAVFAKNEKEPNDNIHEEVPQLIVKYLSKILKVDVTKNPDAFENSVEELISALETDLDNFGTSNTIFKLLSDIVMRSFRVKHTYGDTNEKLIKQLKAKTKEMDPKEAREFILAYTKKQGHDVNTQKQIADLVLGDKLDEPEDELQQFDANVFLINGNYDKRQEGKQKAYVNRDGKWSIWRLATKDRWVFETSVANNTEDKAIEELINASGATAIPMSFELEEDFIYRVTQ